MTTDLVAMATKFETKQAVTILKSVTDSIRQTPCTLSCFSYNGSL